MKASGFLLAAILVLAAVAQADDGLRAFLHSSPGTYGWSPVEGGISYDFFPDGRLHAQGEDGEATMWEGTWSLDGNSLNLKISALDSDATVSVEVEAGDLLLDGKRYRRYSP
jgi:hypothetical protein